MNQSKIYTKEGLLNVINALPLAISVIDRSRKVALANKMTVMFVNKQEADLIGQLGGKAFDCSHHDDVPEGCGFGPECLRCKLRETVMSTLQDKRACSMVETTMSFKTAGQRDLRISTLPMTIDREDVALLGIEDITETKILVETRLEKEKLAAVLETAGAVCHELNQPLMSVTGYTEILLMMVDAENPIQAHLQQIMAQVDRMGKLTKKLMQISRYQTKSYLQGKIIDLEQASVV